MSDNRYYVNFWYFGMTDNFNQLPYFEYTILADNKINYHNSWVTDIHIDKDNE